MTIRFETPPPCADLDPEIFFPDPSKSGRMMGKNHFNMVDETIVALDACARCPVQSACLQEAVNNRETAGIFGGSFPTDRDRVARLPKGFPTAFPFYTKLRRAVLAKRKDLVCPPLPKPTKKYVSYSEYLPFVHVFSQE